MKLLNAAVMPHQGYYHLSPIEPEAFADRVRGAWQENELQHYIGYRETLHFIEHWTGCDLGDTNMEQTTLTDGETFLVLRLNRRVKGSEKVRTVADGQPLRVNDFLFYQCTYHAAATESLLLRKITEITGHQQFSYNLPDQSVYLPRKNSVQKRTVYHLQMDSGRLIGSVLNTQGDENWMRVVFDDSEGCWFPRRRK